MGRKKLGLDHVREDQTGSNLPDHPNCPAPVKAARAKLLHSRMPFVRVYFRDPGVCCHDEAFRFYCPVCQRGIYGGRGIFVGKARRYTLRFPQMCSHHLI